MMGIHYVPQICNFVIVALGGSPLVVDSGLPAPHVGKDGSTQIVTNEFQRQAATETSSKVTYLRGLPHLVVTSSCIQIRALLSVALKLTTFWPFQVPHVAFVPPKALTLHSRGWLL